MRSAPLRFAPLRDFCRDTALTTTCRHDNLLLIVASLVVSLNAQWNKRLLLCLNPRLVDQREVVIGCKVYSRR